MSHTCGHDNHLMLAATETNIHTGCWAGHFISLHDPAHASGEMPHPAAECVHTLA